MTEKKHIVIAPFFGIGCMLPALELARKLAATYRVTVIVCDVVQNSGLKDKVFDFNRHDNMDNVNVKIPASSPLANGVSKSSSPALAKQLLFLESIKAGRLQITSCIGAMLKEEDVKVDALICDFLWGGDIVQWSAEQSIPAYYFCSTSVEDLIIVSAVKPETELNDPNHGDIYTALPSADNTTLACIPYIFKDIYLSAQHGLQYVKGVVVNSVRELSTESMSMLKDYSVFNGIELWCLGPLLPVDHLSRENEKIRLVGEVQTWLDENVDRSVTYVSFGSHVMPRASQLTEVITALKSIGKPVILSLNPRCFADLPASVKAAVSGKINDGSNERLLVLGWAPQTTILAHRALAVFVSHCGWNSTLEAITYGVPVVAWPFISDQKRDGEQLTKLGMAVLLPDVSDHDNSRVVSSEELSAAIETVTGWTGDSSYWNSATEWKEVMRNTRCPNGSSYSDLQGFLQHLNKL